MNGQGHSIHNLSIHGPGHLGLILFISAGAHISNLGLENVEVNSSEDGKTFAGALAGFNRGLVTRCFSTGIVNSHHYAGGLVAGNEGQIKNCYSTASAHGSFAAGGIAASCLGGTKVSFCYSSGLVRADNKAGGLVGYQLQTDISAKRRGGPEPTKEPPIAYCFWDIETSGQSKSVGGTGLTTAEMRDVNTFLDAGWDFVDETDNGTEDIWWMPENDYPMLWWQEPVLP